MRLTLYTDFALRLLMYLSVRQDRATTIQEVADAYGISRNHLMKVAQQLGQIGMVETIRGRGGGLRLGVRPEAVRLGDVVRATEEDFRLVECFDSETNTCLLAPVCRLKGILNSALKAYLAVLDEHTLADLRRQPTKLQELLSITATA